MSVCKKKGNSPSFRPIAAAGKAEDHSPRKSKMLSIANSFPVNGIALMPWCLGEPD
jgi:hypothetical protein